MLEGPEYVKAGSSINLTCFINQPHLQGKHGRHSLVIVANTFFGGGKKEGERGGREEKRLGKGRHFRVVLPLCIYKED